MINNPTWAGIREAYANSFATLKSLMLMCFWAARAIFDMEAKVPKMLSGKPNRFIDPAGYKRYIARWEKATSNKSRRSGLRAVRSCLRDLE